MADDPGPDWDVRPLAEFASIFCRVLQKAYVPIYTIYLVANCQPIMTI